MSLTIYLDKSLQRLAKSGAGWYNGDWDYGVIVYADDLKLFCLTANGL